VPKPPITRNVQQPLDIHLNLRTQCTLYLELIGNDIPDGVQLIIIPLIHLLIEINPGSGQDILSSRTTDPKNIGQSDLSSFIFLVSLHRQYEPYSCFTFLKTFNPASA